MRMSGPGRTARPVWCSGRAVRQPDRTVADVAGAAWLVVEWGNPGISARTSRSRRPRCCRFTPPFVVWVMLAYPPGDWWRSSGSSWVRRSSPSWPCSASLPTCSSTRRRSSARGARRTSPWSRADAEPLGRPGGPGFRVVGGDGDRGAIGDGLWRLGRSSAARRRVAGPGVAGRVRVPRCRMWTSLRSAEPGFIGGGDDRATAVVHPGGRARRGRGGGAVWAVCGCGGPARRSPGSSIELSAAAGGGLRDLLARTLGDDTLASSTRSAPDRVRRRAGPAGRRTDRPTVGRRRRSSATARSSPRSCSIARAARRSTRFSTRSPRRRGWRSTTSACRPTCVSTRPSCGRRTCTGRRRGRRRAAAAGARPPRRRPAAPDGAVARRAHGPVQELA